MIEAPPDGTITAIDVAGAARASGIANFPAVRPVLAALRVHGAIA